MFNEYSKYSLTLVFLLILQSFGSVQASTLQEIQARGKLVVGIKDDSAPLGFYNAQGELVGLEIEIAREIAQEILGSRQAVEFIPLLNQDRLNSLIEGKVDLVIADLAMTPSRLRLVNFSDFYYLDGTGMLTNRAEIVSSENLSGKKIAVLEGSTAIDALKFNLPKTIKLIPVKSYQEGLDLLATKQVDAIAADRSILVGWGNDKPSYHLLPEMFSIAPLAVALPKGEAYFKLQEQVSKAIKAKKESLWLKQHLIYWGLP